MNTFPGSVPPPRMIWKPAMIMKLITNTRIAPITGVGMIVLHGEIFYTLKEAQILIERWRQEYNTFRPHSALGYRPPAPAAIAVVPRAKKNFSAMPSRVPLSPSRT